MDAGKATRAAVGLEAIREICDVVRANMDNVETHPQLAVVMDVADAIESDVSLTEMELGIR